MISRLFATVAFLLVSVAAAPNVRADAKSQARALMQQGGERLSAGAHAEALEKFQAAYNLVPSPNIVYNFGLCYEGLGRLAEAYDAFRAFLKEGKDAPAVNVRRAQQFVDRLRSRIAFMQVTGTVDGVEIVVDGKSRGQGPLVEEIPLDPGQHHLMATKAGQKPFVTRVDVTAGERVKVSIDFGKDEVAEAPAPALPPAPRPTSRVGDDGGSEHTPSTTRADWRRPAAWVVTVVAGVAIATGVALRATAYNDFNGHKEAPLTEDGECTTASSVPEAGGGRCKDLLASGDRRKTLGSVALVTGGVAAAGAAVLFLSSRPSESESGALSCAPRLGQLGATCSIAF